jgi:hypothetical protein
MSRRTEAVFDRYHHHYPSHPIQDPILEKDSANGTSKYVLLETEFDTPYW